MTTSRTTLLIADIGGYTEYMGSHRLRRPLVPFEPEVFVPVRLRGVGHGGQDYGPRTSLQRDWVVIASENGPAPPGPTLFVRLGKLLLADCSQNPAASTENTHTFNCRKS